MNPSAAEQVESQLGVAALGGEVDAVMDAIVVRLQGLVGGDGATLITPHEDQLLYYAACGSLAVLLGQKLPIDDSFAGALLHGADPQIVEDIAAEPRINRKARAMLGGGAMAFVPLTYQDRALGVLAVHSLQPGIFDGSTLEVMAMMGDAATISLRNAELAADIAKRDVPARSLIDEAADAMLVTDDKGVILEANDAAAGLLGYPVETLETMMAVELVDAGELEAKPSQRGDVLRDGVFLGTRRYRRGDGQYVELEASSRLLPNRRVHTALRDVTERSRAETELRENAARLRAIVQTQREITELELDLDAVMDSIAQRVQELTPADGAVVQWFDGEDLVYRFGSGIAEPFVGLHLPRAGSLSGFVCATGETQHCVDAQIDPRVDGDACARIGVRSLICAPLSRNGEIAGVLGVMAHAPHAFDDLVVETVTLMAAFVSAAISNAEELDERKRIASALQESEARFRGAWESAAVGMALVSLDGRYIELNSRYAEILGYSEDELRPLSFRDATHVDDRAFDEQQRRRLLSGEVRSFEHDKRYLRADGAIVWGHISVSAVRGDDDQPLHFVSQLQDVTERKELEISLHESEQLFSEAFESSLVPEMIVDDDRHFVDGNPKACELLGLDRSKVASLRVDDVVGPDVNVAHAWERFLADGSKTGELTLRRADGAERTVEFTATADVQPGRHFALLRDLTEQKELEVQLRQAQKMEAVGRLAGGIAHDFNNLLTAISGYSEFLITGLADDDKLRPHAEEVKRAAERAAGLTRRLLAFSRRQVLQPRVLDLNAVVEDMRMMLCRLIGEDVELITSLDLALDPFRADPSQVEQVIVNLAVNARDAMPGGGTLTIETANIDDPVLGPCVALTISDTGVGMSDEARQNLFEPFFTTKGLGGTGLGLSTVLGIVEQSGGTIDVETAPGSGTTFRILLPRAEQPAEPARTEVLREAPAAGTETILLVEDETIVRQLVSEILRGFGYAVLKAADGPSALELVRRHTGSIDLVVTDVVMPGMSGREVAQAVTSLRPGTQVLYISGYTDSVIDQHGVLDPGTAFLQKPFSAEDLGHKARQLLDERSATPA